VIAKASSEALLTNAFMPGPTGDRAKRIYRVQRDIRS
jgi:hypothetical protein